LSIENKKGANKMKISANEIKNRKLCEGQVGIFYLGQEGYLFKNQDKYLVVDPYLSYYVDENCCQFVEWKRLYEPPIEAEELSFVNVVVCTHSHYDHADPETLSKIAKANPETVFVVPNPVKKDIAAYGINEERIKPN
jgi:L-ascorbate metabolism protein UlaG (beta-lactamase superfamily)